MLILSAEEVCRALPMDQAIAAGKEAFAALAEGRVEMPLRGQVPVKPHDGMTLVMSSFADTAEKQALAVKVVSVFPKNRERGLPLINAAVVVLDPETGRTVGLLDGGMLTALRTGAGCGVATEILARPDAHKVALFGAGVQARTLLEAVCCVRTVRSVEVHDADADRITEFIKEISDQGWCAAELRPAESTREATIDADLVCTATTSAKPVFADADLKPGTHINAIGSYQPHVQELPSETVVRAKVVVDQREAALKETGDLIQPIQQGLITADHLHAELGDLVLGRKAGRSNDNEITLFKSVGLAAQDAMAARAALANARKMGLGTEVEL